MNFVAIDFETSDYSADSACAVGLVRVENGEVVAREHFLIRPPRKRMLFTHIHKIRWEDVAYAPTFGELWPTIEPYFSDMDFIAAHNAGFDQRVLHACCEAYELAPPKQPFLCTVKLAKRIWNLKSAGLSNVCSFLQIPLDHHHALSDASACAEIVRAGLGVPI